MPEVPEELLRALEEGMVSREQLIALITLEAEGLGLTFGEARDQARKGALPRSPLGLDLASLFDLLEDTPVPA